MTATTSPNGKAHETSAFGDDYTDTLPFGTFHIERSACFDLRSNVGNAQTPQPTARMKPTHAPDSTPIL